MDETSTPLDLGTYLKNLRMEKGLSQENLARKLGISGKCVSLWETNKTKPRLAYRQIEAALPGLNRDIFSRLYGHEKGNLKALTIQHRQLDIAHKAQIGLADGYYGILKAALTAGDRMSREEILGDLETLVKKYKRRIEKE